MKLKCNTEKFKRISIPLYFLSLQSDAKKQGNDLILLFRVYHELTNFQLRTVKNLTTLAPRNSKGLGGTPGKSCWGYAARFSKS